MDSNLVILMLVFVTSGYIIQISACSNLDLLYDYCSAGFFVFNVSVLLITIGLLSIKKICKKESQYMYLSGSESDYSSSTDDADDGCDLDDNNSDDCDFIDIDNSGV